MFEAHKNIAWKTQQLLKGKHKKFLVFEVFSNSQGKKNDVVKWWSKWYPYANRMEGFQTQFLITPPNEANGNIIFAAFWWLFIYNKSRLWINGWTS